VAPTPSVKIQKHFTAKGVTWEWSNRYHFNGGTPADPSHWNTLFDNIVAAEKLCLGTNQTIDLAVGYNAGSDEPIASKTYSTAGTFALAGSDVWMPRDSAYLMKWSTTARTSKNHPIYLFNYFHSCRRNASGDINEIQTTQISAYNTYCSAWVSGFSDGSITAVRAGPNGATGAAVLRSSPVYATHRDFPK
jgi:hypothetical protein